MKVACLFTLLLAGCITQPDFSDSDTQDTSSDLGPDTARDSGGARDATVDLRADVSPDSSRTPDLGSPPTGFIQISAGADHACAVDDREGVWCWGNNTDNAVSPTAAAVLPPTKVIVPPALRVAAGDQFTCVLTVDREVWCWGRNDRRQSGAQLSTVVSPTFVFQNSDARNIHAGAANVCIKVDNDDDGDSGNLLQCWGSNESLQTVIGLTIGVSVSPNDRTMDPRIYNSVALGVSHTCARRGSDAQGQSNCWGSNGSNESRQSGCDPCARSGDLSLGGVDQVIRLHAGDQFACGVSNGGAVFCWGRGSEGQRGIVIDTGSPNSENEVPGVMGAQLTMRVATGYTHACAVASGATWCWGSPRFAIGGDSPGPAPRIVTTSALTEISAGRDFTCGISEGRVHCFGRNNFGQLGRAGPDSLDGMPIDVQF